MQGSDLQSRGTGPDFDLVREYLTSIYSNILSNLENVKVPSRLRTIYRPFDDGFGGSIEPVPIYQYADVFTSLREVSPAAELLDYLWGYRRLIWRYADAGFLESRKEWEPNICHWLIAVPMLLALEEFAVEQLVENQQVKHSFEDKALFNDKVELVVANLKAKAGGQQKATYRLIFPIAEIQSSFDGEIILGPTIRIRRLNVKERGIFYSRYGSWMQWEEPLQFTDILECEISYSRSEVGSHGSNVNAAFQQKKAIEKINLLKWAMMLAAGQEFPLLEGTAIVTTQLGQYSTSVRRRDVIPGSYRVPRYKIAENEVETCRVLISNFRDVTEEVPELWNVLWYFGRATVASTTRDAFLEAVIGLDSILVSGGANAVYKFRLHGVCLLADQYDGEALFKELGDLYGHRSGAAHGKKHEVDEKDSCRAMHLLAEAIRSLTDLYKNGKLDSGEKRIAQSVERFVLRKVSMAT